MLTSVILLIGDELLAGEIMDRNGPYFADRLYEEGFRVERFHVLPDETEAIAQAVQDGSKKYDLIILCGGLGSTSDDLTTEAVARALGKNLVFLEEHWERMRQIFSMLRGQEPPPENRKQATIPEGALALANSKGTALGHATMEGNCAIGVFPGPPRENQPMFENEFLPWLENHFPDRPRLSTKIFRVFGLPESMGLL